MLQRAIHCSYCLEEGHHINKCKDETISLLNEEIQEIAAIDWKLNLNSGFVKNKLSSLTFTELKVIGYKHNVPNISKIKSDDLIKCLMDIFLSNTNTHIYIIDALNLDELDYFADKVYQYTLRNNHDEFISNDDIRALLYKDHPAYIKYDIVLILDNSSDDAKEQPCPMCLEHMEQDDMVITNCGHTFCCKCMIKHIRTNQLNRNDTVLCPMCRTDINFLKCSTQDTVNWCKKKTMLNEYGDDVDLNSYRRLPRISDVFDINMDYISYGAKFVNYSYYTMIGIGIAMLVHSIISAINDPDNL